MTKFAQCQSEALFQNGTFFKTSHNANLKHVSEWCIFRTARNTCMWLSSDINAILIVTSKICFSLQFAAEVVKGTPSHPPHVTI